MGSQPFHSASYPLQSYQTWSVGRQGVDDLEHVSLFKAGISDGQEFVLPSIATHLSLRYCIKT